MWRWCDDNAPRASRFEHFSGPVLDQPRHLVGLKRLGALFVSSIFVVYLLRVVEYLS